MLDAVKTDNTWYCSPACAEGHPNVAPDPPAVPEPWLYSRPRRFLHKRTPKELRAAEVRD